MKKVSDLNIEASITCADTVIDSILEQGGQLLYNNYLKPKILPYGAKLTMQTVTMPSKICNIEHDPNIKTGQPINQLQYQEPVVAQYCTWSEPQKLFVPQQTIKEPDNFTDTTSNTSQENLLKETLKQKNKGVSNQRLLRRGTILIRQPTKLVQNLKAEELQKPEIKVVKKEEISPEQLEMDRVDNEHRQKKLNEDKLRQAEIQTKKERRKAAQNKKGSDEVSRALTKLKGVKDIQGNLFEQLYQRGEGLTFDHAGIPMVYKQQVSTVDLLGLPSYELKKGFEFVKNQIKTKNLSQENTAAQSNYQSTDRLLDNFTQVLDPVQEQAYTSSLKAMVIQAGVQYQGSGRDVINGPPLMLLNKISLTDYGKIMDNKTQQVRTRQSSLDPKTALDEIQNILKEDPYVDFKKNLPSQRVQTAHHSNRKQDHTEIKTKKQIPRTQTETTLIECFGSKQSKNLIRPTSSKVFDVVKHDQNSKVYQTFIKETQLSLTRNNSGNLNDINYQQAKQLRNSYQNVNFIGKLTQTPQSVVPTTVRVKNSVCGAEQAHDYTGFSRSPIREYKNSTATNSQTKISIYKSEIERKQFQNLIEAERSHLLRAVGGREKSSITVRPPTAATASARPKSSNVQSHRVLIKAKQL